MKPHLALLRGINVGGKAILRMKELAELFNELGCEEVCTYIQSGNVIFRAAPKTVKGLAERVAKTIAERHDVEPQTLILTAQQLQEVIDECPFESEAGNQLHFSFLFSKPRKPDLETLRSLQADDEQFQLGKRAFYLLAPSGIGRSKLAAKVEACLGVPTTSRNANTINKLQTILASL